MGRERICTINLQELLRIHVTEKNPRISLTMQYLSRHGDLDLQTLTFALHFLSPPDVLHAPLEWRLVEQTRASLQEASDNLIQLYKRISLDHSLDEGLRHRFLQDLVSSADLAQATLRPLAQPHQVSSIAQLSFSSL